MGGEVCRMSWDFFQDLQLRKVSHYQLVMDLVVSITDSWERVDHLFEEMLSLILSYFIFSVRK
jgi:hypothetical protein